MPYQSFKVILQITQGPRFKIWNLLNQLRNERFLLWNHKSPHQIRWTVIVLLLQVFWQISETSIDILMYMANNKETQFDFLKHILRCQQ